MKHSFLKKMLASLMALCLIVTMIPATAFADDVDTEVGVTRIITGQRADVSRPEKSDESAESSEAAVDPRLSAAKTYSPDEIVTVIVMLDEPAAADYYDQAPAAIDLDGEEMSPGKRLAAYLASDMATAITEQNKAQQSELLSRISALSLNDANAENGIATVAALPAQVRLVAQFTGLINAMSVKMPYGLLEQVQKMDGVKKAYVEKTYSIPEDEELEPLEGGLEKYGYAQAGVKNAWADGYTGQGMVVAVLDTSLDIYYDSWYDSSIDENVTGVRACHEAFREDSFKSDNPQTFVSYTEGSIQKTLNLLQNFILAEYIAPGGNWYKNLKVPYAADYSHLADDGRVDDNVRSTETHGSHVSGTIAGYVETEDGEVKFSGIAPDAQIAFFKVFNDEGSMTSSTPMIAALNDVAYIGADVVNLSLGSNNGFEYSDSAEALMFETLREFGVVASVANGNSGNSVQSNTGTYGYALAENPDVTMTSAPAIYDNALAVAAVNTEVRGYNYLYWSDGTETHRVAYSDTGSRSGYLFGEIWEGEMTEKNGIYACGIGQPADYDDVDWEYTAHNPPTYEPEDAGSVTGFALVQRGTISFSEKATNASRKSEVTYDPAVGKPVVTKGIKGVIVYNNEPGTINMDLTDCSTTDYCPAISISMADGEEILAAIEAGKDVTLTFVNTEFELGEWDTDPYDPDQPGQPSSFTSWGAGPGLEFKPDVAAPGGQIYSTVPDLSYNMNAPGSYDDYTGTYEYMDGTSMATPHVAGIAALVTESVRNSKYPSLNNLPQYLRADVVNHLIVSTANPIKDYKTDYTTYVSPRIQGAGMVNAGAAVETPVYAEVTMEQSHNGVAANVGKLELLDDADWSGSFDFAFNLVNLDTKDHTYKATMYTMTPDVDTDGLRLYYMEWDRMLSTTDLGTFTAAANSDTEVTGNVTYDPAEIQALSPNGTYIEGYIILTPVDEDIPELTVPFLGFAGDWTKPPILDTLNWYDLNEQNDALIEQVLSAHFVDDAGYGIFYGAMAAFDGMNYPLYLGTNPFVDMIGDEENSQFLNLGPYYMGNFAISPNGDGYLDGINYVEAYQLRDARLMLFEVTDKNTGEVYYHDFVIDIPRTPFTTDSSTGIVYPSPYSLNLTYMGFDYDGFKITDPETFEYEYLPNGTEVEFKLALFGEGDYEYAVDDDGVPYATGENVFIDKPETWPTFNGHPMDMTGDIMRFDLLIDTEAPAISDNVASITKQEDGTYLFECEFDDGKGSIADVSVYPYVHYTVKEEYADYAEMSGLPISEDSIGMEPIDEQYIFDEDTNTYKYSCVLPDPATYTEEGPYGMYDGTWNDGVFYVFCGDYAANDGAYIFQIDDRLTAEGEINALWEYGDLYIGGSAPITIIDNTGVEGDITYTSSDETVATVDENGVVTAVGEGTAIITIEKAGKTATVVINVKDDSDEITDFRFSVEDYKTLRPGESIIIRAEDIVPSEFNGVNSTLIFDSEWTVNDPNWEHYGEGADPFPVIINDDPYDEYFQKEAQITFDSYIAGLGGYVPGTSGVATLTVTLNGCTKTTNIYYEVPLEEDYLVSAEYSRDMTKYIEVSDAVELAAQYSDISLHQPPAAQVHFRICASSGYTFDETSWSGTVDTTVPGEGLYIVPATADAGSYDYTGYICAEPGYDLPAALTAVGIYRSEYDSFTPLINTSSYYKQWDYDPATGEFNLGNVPYDGADLIIFADGVKNEASLGTTPPEGFVDPSLGGGSEQTADGLYGPFDWSVTDVNGAPVTTEYQLIENNDEYNSVTFVTPVPGVYRVTATTKSAPAAAASIMAPYGFGIMPIAETGKLSVTWTIIVSKPATDSSIQLVPDTSDNEGIDNVNYSLVYEVGDSPEQLKLVAYDGNGNQIPLDGLDLIWESNNESVVTVDENGVVTIVGEGIAIVTVKSASNQQVDAHFVIKVNEKPHTHTLVWRYNTTSHWQVCTDGDYTGASEMHNFIGHVCTVCGYLLPYAQPTPLPNLDTLNIQFTVVDGAGNELPALAMYLNSVNLSSMTDANGRAFFRNIGFGSYTISVGTSTLKFDVVRGSAFELNGTTVTAPVNSTIELTLVYDGGVLSFEEVENFDESIVVDIPQQGAIAHEEIETVADAA